MEDKERCWGVKKCGIVYGVMCYDWKVRVGGSGSWGRGVGVR